MSYSRLISLVLAASVATALPEEAVAQPVMVKIDLIQSLQKGEVEYHLNPESNFNEPPEKVWLVENGQLHITGRAFGYAATKASYRDYRMVVEYRWGERTWGSRQDKARDNGFFVHAHGPHGFLNGSWMESIETQIIEGGTGDLLVIAPKPPQSSTSTSLKSAFAADRDGEKIWRPGSPLSLVTRGRINWLNRDENWKDVKGFRGKKDVERPVGEWNLFEVVASGGLLQVFLNGVLVNEAREVKPSEGRILSTCLGAELFIRRWELWPLGQPERGKRDNE